MLIYFSLMLWLVFAFASVAYTWHLMLYYGVHAKDAQFGPDDLEFYRWVIVFSLAGGPLYFLWSMWAAHQPLPGEFDEWHL